MKVTIWDLDYYYANKKVNCFNPDVMKISSYHKQLGDSINFVTKEYDIYRPYDLCYIIKEKDKTPNPPMSFFLDKTVRWWGKAFKVRINWKMSDAMLGCRPDYLLYPEQNTKLERAEHIRFFNDRGQPLQWVQEWRNTFQNKTIIVTDTAFWFANKKDILKALEMLASLEKVSFFEPIFIQKIISDEEIKEAFLKLKFKRGTVFNWSAVRVKDIKKSISFIYEVSNKNPTTSTGMLIFDYMDKNKSHWDDKENAINDFKTIVDIFQIAVEKHVKIKIKMPINRFQTPYFELFENLSYWSECGNFSWLEFITKKYPPKIFIAKEDYWNTPSVWHPVFRDLLLQTRMHKYFLLTRWNGSKVSENDIPWNKWEKEFINGI